MLYGTQVELDYWRNFIPYAPNLEVEVLGEPNQNISLKEWMVQGARDLETGSSPDPDVLANIPVQRGWLLSTIVIEEPRFGTVEPSADGFTYTARDGYEGPDCFTYVFTNGTQKSLMARVDVTVARSYSLDYSLITYDATIDQYNIYLTPYTPPTETRSLLFQRFDWYWVDYQNVVNVDGQDRAYPILRRFAGTSYLSDITTGNYPRIINDGLDVRLNGLPTDEDIVAFAGNTDVPYRPTGEPYQILVRARYYYTHLTRRTLGGYLNGKPWYYDARIGLNFSAYEEAWIPIEQDYGPRWWESGNIDRLDLGDAANNLDFHSPPNPINAGSVDQLQNLGDPTSAQYFSVMLGTTRPTVEDGPAILNEVEQPTINMSVNDQENVFAAVWRPESTDGSVLFLDYFWATDVIQLSGVGIADIITTPMGGHDTFAIQATAPGTARFEVYAAPIVDPKIITIEVT